MTLAKPLAMGAIMGLMMLWMVHGALTGGGPVPTAALIGFVAVHLALALLAVGAAIFAARLSPRARAWLARIHRPRPAHLVAMISGLTASAGLVHLAVHGIA